MHRDEEFCGATPQGEVEAGSEAEAKELAVSEFQEMVNLSRPVVPPHLVEGQIRVERAPVRRAAALEITTEMLAPMVATTRLVGAVGSGNFHQLQECLDELKTAGVSRLVLDLSALTYVNSTGLSLFIAAGDLFDVRLAAVPVRITRLLKMIGLDKLFASYMSVAEAARAPAAEKPAG